MHRNWSDKDKNDFIFSKTTGVALSFVYNGPYSGGPAYTRSLSGVEYHLFEGMERHCKTQKLKMGVIIVATEKLAKAFCLNSKNKFDSMGLFSNGFDKNQIIFTSKTKDLSHSSNTKNYVFFETGLQVADATSNPSFELQVKDSSSIPVSSTQVVGTVITKTKEKIIEIKNESGGGKKFDRKRRTSGRRQGKNHVKRGI